MKKSDYYGNTPDWVKGIGIVFVALVFLWIFVLEPLVKWIQQNWSTIIIYIISVASIIIFAFMFYTFFLLNGKREREKRKIFEKEQEAKGLINFVDRRGAEKWGKPKEVEEWRKMDKEAEKKESFINKVTESIEEF